jgi:hypothetical protein
MTPAQTDKFYEDRGLIWEEYIGYCEARGDTLVKMIDDANMAAEDLEKARRRK